MTDESDGKKDPESSDLLNQVSTIVSGAAGVLTVAGLIVSLVLNGRLL